MQQELIQRLCARHQAGASTLEYLPSKISSRTNRPTLYYPISLSRPLTPSLTRLNHRNKNSENLHVLRASPHGVTKHRSQAVTTELLTESRVLLYTLCSFLNLRSPHITPLCFVYAGELLSSHPYFLHIHTNYYYQLQLATPALHPHFCIPGIHCPLPHLNISLPQTMVSSFSPP